MKKDYVIIGGGPCGLTLAYTLGSLGYKCTLIDNHDTLGGCHRVTRVNGLFTEHGPRIYSSAYRNVRMLLEKMGHNFFDLFTPYDFNISRIGGKTLEYFTPRELSILVLEFLKLFMGIESSRSISIGLFAIEHHFSPKAQDYLDRICRLTDGAGSDRYTLYEFLSLINQNLFYRLYQPRLPNDIGLFRVWEEAILNNGNVEILNDTKVEEIIRGEDEKIIGIKCKSKEIERSFEIDGKNFLFCIPPKPFLDILKKSSKSILDSYPGIGGWTFRNTYINDIPITFHWNRKLQLPKIWGFPSTDWGVAFIVLSNYMDFQDPRSQTVISTCITNVDKKSSITGKTANETISKDELIGEVFRQLREAFPSLPQSDYSILHPGVYRDEGRGKSGEWIETDTAYVETFYQEFIEPQNGVFKNLYFVGTQNGDSFYSFTSMESAVSNALSLLHLLHPSSKKDYPMSAPFSLIKLLRIILLTVLVLIAVFFLIKTFRKNKNKREKRKEKEKWMKFL